MAGRPQERSCGFFVFCGKLRFSLLKRQESATIKIRGGVLLIDKLSADLKTLVLLGIGAAALTAEKSKELIDELVKKGELSIEQGKVLNEELKHRVRETIADAKETTARQRMEKLQEQVKQLSKEELEALKDLIAQQENTTTDEE